ncbi:hypothetical protein LB505_000743 [Fusarium chuoi]|nr:hypothetical protein LB505_000743 [Fusarium chuoi]
MCVMSNNENLEKAGFYIKTAEPRITGPLPHGSLTYTLQYRLFRNQALGPGERKSFSKQGFPLRFRPEALLGN